MTDGDLVHFNLAMARHPLGHPSMAGFSNQVEAVNRLAEASPGFIWTPAEGEAGDAKEVFGSELILANMSTWRSIEHLQRFVYSGMHGRALGQRDEWFQPARGPAYVLWWAPRGSRPRWLEAKQRLEALAAAGPTPQAFTFKSPFTSAAGVALEIREVLQLSPEQAHQLYGWGREHLWHCCSQSHLPLERRRSSLCAIRGRSRVRSVTLRR